VCIRVHLWLISLMDAQVLAKVIRGETIESVHSGHVSIINGDGKTVFEVGDPSTVTYFRSAAKPFQALPFITSGAADAFAFTEKEIALACASHSGEVVHVAIAARMLAKIGCAESDLKCGTHLPFSEVDSKHLQRSGEEPTQLHNNCSGKHAAMLAFAKHIDADIGTYDSSDNHIQKRILKCISDFTEVPEGDIAVGIDGCAVPNFAVSVRAMAKSAINLVHPAEFHETIQAASSRVVSAMTEYPELIGGSNRLDTQLMQAAPGGIISKVGADGVWLCGILPCEKWPTGLGIALKIADGDDHRARPVVAVEILRQLGILTAGDLIDISPMPIKNRCGDAVGRVTASLRVMRTN
jgi:L-asparaginase II